MSDNIMTRQGYETLKEKLRKLKVYDRQEVIELMRTAAAHGDLSENAEYDAAKERQMFIEGKIKELEQKIATAKVIDTSNLVTDKVVFGVTVRLNDDDRDEEVTYQIVGVDEADVAQGKISIRSPLAQALIGKMEGDSISVKTPGGIRHYTILEITNA
ncbi:MAG: transcription elongation factor GreA [Desulfobacterota bacterium]|nr:transcription elongation factor GreA [Thermodesulfobacteriota bacterium]